MDITFKDIPDELAAEIRSDVKGKVERYYKDRIQIPQSEIDKAEANIRQFKEANKEAV